MYTRLYVCKTKLEACIQDYFNIVDMKNMHLYITNFKNFNTNFIVMSNLYQRACIHAYVHTHAYLHIYIQMPITLHIHVHMHKHTFTHIHIYIQIQNIVTFAALRLVKRHDPSCMYEYICIHTYTDGCIYKQQQHIQNCVCVYTYVYICTCIYIYKQQQHISKMCQYCSVATGQKTSPLMHVRIHGYTYKQ